MKLRSSDVNKGAWQMPCRNYELRPGLPLLKISPCSHHFPWEQVDDLWASPKSEDVGLIVPAISFQDFQPMWTWSTNVTDGQTDDMRSL